MKLKFLGDEFPNGISTGTRISFPIQKILNAYRKDKVIRFDYYGRAVEEDISDFVAIKAETVEDTLFLEELKKKVVSHRKILLCNYEIGLINPDFAYFSVGGYFLDGKWEVNNHAEQTRTWHYLVSEMVKEEGVPYAEIVVFLNENKNSIEKFQLKYFDGEKTQVVHESSNVYEIGLAVNEFLGFKY